MEDSEQGAMRLRQEQAYLPCAWVTREAMRSAAATAEDDTKLNGSAGNEDDATERKSLLHPASNKWREHTLWRSGRSLVSRAPIAELGMLFATFIYALQSLIAKEVEEDLPPMEVVLVRSFFAGMITVGTMLRQHIVARQNGTETETLLHEVLGPPNCRWILTLRAMLGATAFSLTYSALKPLGVALHTSLFFTHPLFSALLSWPLLGERLGILEACAIFFCAGGTLMVVQPPAVFGNLSSRAGDPEHLSDTSGMGYTPGVIAQLCSALLAGGAMMAVRLLSKQSPSPSVLAIALWFHAFSSMAGVLILSMRAVVPGWSPPAFPNARNAALLLTIACTSFVGQYLLTYGYAWSGVLL